MPQIREQIAMVHLPPSKTLKYLFHVRKTEKGTCGCKCLFQCSSLLSNGRSSFAVKFCSANEKYACGV